ncbi:hypothetical protein CLAFUW4_09455 [Fulvia fulva]|uniref:MIT domain-containing protein n=1 Tax=Passalora fulva TaxID=5499 RepID=A0A9Q8PFK3_PASFU|nr:uncharacterized protein CLAFUR5_09552 [Fulvia fulva]KAK4613507.1 hypothetical protein CLAFUR4_09461 [Fulvia fulva]UJO21515.1 hypothetical protein CLAFUR5_09552 [Fulvia fulva]WPV20356.1 hypothetical protein CLAFUW4_09455 [Fulvia fulva]WPV35074.1 hypothetical protein CLAFUW7_09456 [Fulvia fulva]
MQAGTSHFSAHAVTTSAPFDTANASQYDSAALLDYQHRQSHRSNSLSSGSIVTVGRPSSLARVPSADASLTPLNLGRDPMSPAPAHKRRRSVAIEPSDDQYGAGLDSVGALNRWSHSTTSSVASNARRNRSSSGAVLSSLVGHVFSPRQKPLTALDPSPRSSPHKRNVASNSSDLTASPDRSRRTSRIQDLSGQLTALPSLHTTPALTDPNDIESPSTTQTVPTPSTHQPYTQTEYFEGDDVLSPYGMAKAKRVVMVRNNTAPMQVNHSGAAGSDSQETLKNNSSSLQSDEASKRRSKTADDVNGHRRPRNRERSEKDKKTMLSKALQKANTAVLLDNAQNYEGALEAYGDACGLLMQVMERTSGEDDKRKLDAIRVTYSNRMEELRQLAQERPTTSDDKDLPARPMSDDSLSLKSPGPLSSPVNGAFQEASLMASPTSRSKTDSEVPRLSYPRKDRDSFFQRTMEAVDSSFHSDSQEEPFHEQQASPGAEEEQVVFGGRSKRKSVHLPPPQQDQFMPRPLSPRRPGSPNQEAQSQENWQQEEETAPSAENGLSRGRADSKDSTSWLDTIDESGDSCSDSDDFHDEHGKRRKHIRGASNGTDPDFDAAFDAAVEAAYDEGLEPDLEARKKRMTALRRTQNGSVQIPASDIDEIEAEDYEQPSVLGLDADDEEEERILDEITQDYGSAFNFDLGSKSALPRQSDSSGYSRSTWQSSQVTDRHTAATSLSTVAEDVLSSNRLSKQIAHSRPRGESSALPPPSGPPPGPPPTSALPTLPRPPSASNNQTFGVRSRRLSALNSKQLKIETSPGPSIRKRASTFHHTASPFAEEHEDQDASEQEKLGAELEPTPSDSQHENMLQSPPSLEFHQALDDMTGQDEQDGQYRPSYEEVPGELPGLQPTLFRKNKSSVSLREHAGHQLLVASPDPEAHSSLATPMSSTFMTFASKRQRDLNPLTSQRATLPSFAQADFEQQVGGGIFLFDTSLSAKEAPVSPRSPNLPPLPIGLEPCPEPFLLRPFWLMRGLSQTITHPRGGFLSTKLFVPREVWQTRGVKLKLVEDKVANCDLLTAALGRLAGVDTYDADAVMDELQSFEEVMERVQAALAKKLGSDVGVHGVTGMFRDASSATVASAMGHAHGADNPQPDKAAKSNSGKSYLTSWRKLRNKSSGAPLSTNTAAQPATAKPGVEKEQHLMPSVPMTNFVPVERRGTKRDARNLVFEGPNKEYMGSLARLFDGVQVLDQIARQVEDPGLKHSSPTHVGLELSIRHAAEFFGFYVCRFVLADLGLLMEKYLKRGTEWVLA